MNQFSRREILKGLMTLGGINPFLYPCENEKQNSILPPSEGLKSPEERIGIIEKGLEGMQRADVFHTGQIQSLNRRVHRIEMENPTQWYQYRSKKGGSI